MASAAIAADQPANQWANFLTGKPGQDNLTAIATDGTDRIYWFATDASTSADRDVTYDGAKLYDGAEYSGTGANLNMTLLKTDADGNAQWCIHSNYGDFLASSGGVAVTATGDVVFCGKVRHTDGALDKPVSFTDAKNNTITLDWSVEQRYQRLYIAKCTSDGELLWVRTCDLETAMNRNGKTFASDAVSPNGIAVDADGNIYVGGNFRATMSVEKQDGSIATISPKNLAKYDGSVQGSCGAMFLLKLDSDGYYLNSITESGNEISESKIIGLEYADGKLYVNGTATGLDDTSRITFAGVELTPATYPSPIIASLNTDLSANWVTLLPGGTDELGSNNAVQNTATTFNNGTLWYCGQFSGKISDPANASNSVATTYKKNTREGFLIKLDAATGSWVKGVASQAGFADTFITAYLKPICPAEEPENVYVYGYGMNAASGVFMRCYNSGTLAADSDNSWILVKAGAVPTAVGIAYVPQSGAIFTGTRTNSAAEPLGGTVTEKPAGFTTLLSCFKMGTGFTSGIKSIGIDTDSADNTDDTPARYFTIDGTEVATPVSGLYIRLRGSKAEKVIF